MKNKYTIIIPHYKVGELTAYCLHKVIENSKGWDIDIVVITNSGVEGVDKFERFLTHPNVWMYHYPAELMQSHGLAFEYALDKGYVTTDYFITLETDSMPMAEDWLTYYDDIISEGYDMAGSLLKLSGGEFIHPAGAMYKVSNWVEAKKLVNKISAEYDYYPNALQYNGFKCHAMLKGQKLDQTISLRRYEPIAHSVFHQGMGARNEELATYGQRTIHSDGIESNFKPLNNIIYRMGYEPAQWFCYWHYAFGKKVKQIPTEVVWMPNRVNQQQEYTMTANGVKHYWGGTAMSLTDNAPSIADITERKKQLVQELYNSIPSITIDGFGNQNKNNPER